MSRPPLPEDLTAELTVTELAAKADRAERAVWSTAAQLVDERRLTVETVATLTGVSNRTAARRLAEARQRGPGSP